MGLLGIIGGVMTAGVVVCGVGFVLNRMSEKERRRQREMLDRHKAYKNRRYQQYHDNYTYYHNSVYERSRQYAAEQERYRQELVAKRKKENKGFFEERLAMLQEQRDDKSKLLEDCRKIVLECRGSEEQQNSYLRYNSIKTTLRSLEEAVYKLEAYLEYLTTYEKKLKNLFEEEGDLEEPFSYTLPEGYPYEGQLVYLSPTDFVNQGYVFSELGYVRLEDSDCYILETNNADKLPFMLYKYKNRAGKETKYLSYTRGMLKNSIGGTIGIDVEVKNIKGKFIDLRFMKNDYLKISISKSALINTRKRTPIGSNLHVFVIDYDFALKERIKTSERVEDGFCMMQFEEVYIAQTQKEHDQFLKYLTENELLEEDDEWRIGPVWGEENTLEGIILQQGTSYALQARFEEYSIDDKPGVILKYEKWLEKDELLAFDDVFVTANLTIIPVQAQQFKKQQSVDLEKLEECNRLQMYLISEFMIQKNMLVNSPMSIYLKQWAEITNRLIEVLSIGKKIVLDVGEYEANVIMGEHYTSLYIDNSENLEKYLEKEKRDGRYKFYIQLDKYRKLMCTIHKAECGLLVSVKGEITEQELLERDFKFDMYSIANPYAEKQHVLALDSFREGRVANEMIKTTILDIASALYQDNGNRIKGFLNTNILTNEAQMNSVVRSFAEDKFFMIQGPPGTGKTTVIKEIILQQLVRMSTSKVLVVSQANVAVDNVLRGIVEIIKKIDLIDDRQIVRCGENDKIAEDLAEYSFEYKYKNYIETLKNSPVVDEISMELRQKWLEMIEGQNNADIIGECLLSCFQIIGVTCVGLENRRYGLSGMEFDLVIIDEAGKALPGELLIPINRAKKTIIIGDHKQLPPVINPALYKNGTIDYEDVVEEEEQDVFLNKSFFQRLYEDCPDTMKGMLKTQFRMPPVIADMVNMFYDGELVTGQNCYGKKPIFLNNNLIFIDMKNDKKYQEIQEEYAGRKLSPYNAEEVNALLEILVKLRQYYKQRIVIITPYKKQKQKIIEGLRNHGQLRNNNIWVNTVDAFQGDEENIVIFCMTRSKQPTKYFSDNARLNVAFSRAKNTLILLGDSRYFKRYGKEHILRRISEYLTDRACIIDYYDFIKEDCDMLYNESYLHPQVPIEEQCLLDFNMDSFFEEVSQKNVKQEVATCQHCHKELEAGETFLCSSCINKTMTLHCKCCNSNLEILLYDKYIRKIDIPELCEECMRTNCQDCGAEVFAKKAVVKKLKRDNKKCLCKKCNNLYRTPIVYPCKVCGTEIKISYVHKKKLEEEGKTLPEKCQSCSMVKVGICEACGKDIMERDFIMQKADYQKPAVHKECQMVSYQVPQCKSCGNKFVITYKDKAYYKRKGFDMPKRCEKCRRLSVNGK